MKFIEIICRSCSRLRFKSHRLELLEGSWFEGWKTNLPSCLPDLPLLQSLILCNVMVHNIQQDPASWGHVLLLAGVHSSGPLGSGRGAHCARLESLYFQSSTKLHINVLSTHQGNMLKSEHTPHPISRCIHKFIFYNACIQAGPSMSSCPWRAASLCLTLTTH